MTDGKTGIFFDELTVESLWNAIQRFNKVKWNKEKIMEGTLKYFKENFKKQMLELVEKYAGAT